MEEEEDFDGKRVIFDEYKQKISSILDHLYLLLNPAKPMTEVFDDPCHHINKCLSHIDNSLGRISYKLKEVKPRMNMDHCLLEQLEEQLVGLKLKLFDVS